MRSPLTKLALASLSLLLWILAAACSLQPEPSTAADPRPTAASSGKVTPDEPLPAEHPSGAAEAQEVVPAEAPQAASEKGELVLGRGSAGRKAARDLSLNPRSMQQWMKRITPGKNHDRLDFMVGDWDAEGRIWIAPGAPPGKLVGASEGRWVLGRRFVETHFRGKAMGLPFEGRAKDGYDNTSEEYVGTWTDTMNTGIWNFRGRAETPSRRVMKAEINDPLSGGAKSIKSVTTKLSGDQYKFEAFEVRSDGSEFKNLEIVFTRRLEEAGKGSSDGDAAVEASAP